jgi:hypothetical protein
VATGPTKRSQYSGGFLAEKWDGKCSLRWRSMLMAVAKAEGLATVDPLLRVVVAFSVVRTEPVELIFCAREKTAVSSQAMHKESFMAKTREKNNVN